ncbi:MAG: alpha/beta hydrolase family protein [Promethearchaeota archaeon]
METKKFFGVIIVIGVSLTLIPLGLIYYEDNVLKDYEFVSFQDPEGERLEGTYYPGSRDVGVILLYGYAGDQTIVKGIATEFAKLGFHVFSFDFSGNGKSTDAMELLYTRSDRLAKQVIAGKEIFKELSGLDDSEIILFGHSMGARAALQSSTLDKNRAKMLVLFGCFVNLEPKARSDVHGLPRDFELEWIKSLSANNPLIDILLLTGELDDTSTPHNNLLLYQKLGGNSSKYTRELVIIDDLIHGYEIFSPEAITYAINWIMINLELKSTINYSSTTMIIRKICWSISAIGIFIITIGGSLFFKTLKFNDINQNSNSDKNQVFSNRARIVSMKKFLLFKFLFWFAAIPIIIGIFILFLLIPLGLPFISLICASSIGGNGLLMIWIFSKEKMPGIKNILKFNLKVHDIKLNYNLLGGFVLILFLIFTSTIFACSGLFNVFYFNDRFFWLILLTLFLIPGFYIMQLELECFSSSNFKKNQRRNKILLIISEIFPFFSFAAMLGSLHGIIILCFVLSGGVLVHKIGKNTALTIIFQAFLLNYLLLAHSVLYPGFIEIFFT